MALTVTQPHEHIPVDNILLSIYSDPSVGKTTLGLAGERVLHIDSDIGAHRVDYKLRRSPIQEAKIWEQLVHINQQDLLPFDTIVLDTAQRLLESIKTYLSKDSRNTMATGALKLHVQQQANILFQNFINKLISWKKNIVFLSHMIEVKSDDDKVAYKCPDIGGKNKQDLYRMSDCMAYYTWASTPDNPTRRLLKFSTNDPSYHSKDCAGLKDLEVPDLMNHPTFLTDLIQRIKDKLNEMSPEQRQQIKLDGEWQHWQKICQEARYASEFNSLVSELAENQTNPRFESMWNCLKHYATEAGLIYDKQSTRWNEQKETA